MLFLLGLSPPAAASVTKGVNFDADIATLQREIEETFASLFRALEKRKLDLLSQLSAMKAANDKNIELAEAIKQLRIAKEDALKAMTSNLLKEVVDPLKRDFDYNISLKEKKKVPIANLSLIEFRCLSEQILKGIEETDLVELIPEYVGREYPILEKCPIGTRYGEFNNPRGIAIDLETNELYITDMHNSRVQVMDTNGNFLRAFGHELMLDLHAVCLSQTAVFLSDRKNYLLKFSKAGKYLKKTGSHGFTPGCFIGIGGLCCEGYLIYVCDINLQQILIFNHELIFVKWSGYGEIRFPTDVKFYSGVLYIISEDGNEIYRYSKEGRKLNTIQLVGQKVPMKAANFFTIDSKGNFLATDSSSSEIRIFSMNGVHKHSLGTGHMKFLFGIALDHEKSIICVNFGEKNNCFQKY